jgi:hypothetical protein
MDCTNYSNTLIGWANGLLDGSTPQGVTLGAAGLQYCGTEAAAAHLALTQAGWTITDGGEALPITLQNFTAQAQKNNTALLQWTTVTESNSKGFAVQRSIDGANFTTLNFVNSKAAGGNSSAQLNYSYTDTHPLSGVNYYRLAQTDLDGTITYSEVRSLRFNNLLRVYPNPVQSILTITGIQSAATYKLLNASGATVLRGTLQASDKNQISVSSIASGIYFLRVVMNGIVSTYKVQVVK